MTTDDDDLLAGAMGGFPLAGVELWEGAVTDLLALLGRADDDEPDLWPIMRVKAALAAYPALLAILDDAPRADAVAREVEHVERLAEELHAALGEIASTTRPALALSLASVARTCRPGVATLANAVDLTQAVALAAGRLRHRATGTERRGRPARLALRVVVFLLARCHYESKSPAAVDGPSVFVETILRHATVDGSPLPLPRSANVRAYLKPFAWLANEQPAARRWHRGGIPERAAPGLAEYLRRLAAGERLDFDFCF